MLGAVLSCKPRLGAGRAHVDDDRGHFIFQTARSRVRHTARGRAETGVSIEISAVHGRMSAERKEEWYQSWCSEMEQHTSAIHDLLAGEVWPVQEAQSRCLSAASG